MKKSFFKRLASAFMAGVMMFTSNSFGIKTFSDNVNSPAGVGIYNHVLTEDSSAKTKYVLYFYKNFGTELVAPSNDLLNLSSLNLSSYQGEENQDGVSVYVDANNNLILSNDNAFKEFVNDYHIDKIRIEYVTEMIDGKNTSLLYKDNVAEEYEFYELVHGDNGEPDTLKDILNYNQENPFENINETLKVYDSTRMKDVIVEQEWHDRGGDKRPSIKNLKFDLIQNTNDSYLTNFEYVNSAEENPNLYTYTASGEEDEVTVYLELENKDSITYQYIYTVPECAPDGTVYNYSSKLSDTTQLNQDDYKTVDTQTVNKYKAIGLTSFNFTLNWEDDYDPTARPIIDADFIKNNFTLYKRVKTTDENGNTIYTGTVLTDEEKNDMIIETDGDTVTIKRLVDISEVGTANEYYLQINNAQSKLSVNQKDYSNSVDKLNDYYAVKSENHGVHAHETDKTYDNGDFTLRLTGKVSFTGNVIWDDIDTATIRQQDEDAASFDLWRYAGNDIDYSAKVGSPLTIAGKPDGAVTQEEMKTNTFTFGLDENNNYTLDKYDVNGQLYTYYAKETVSVEKTGAGETGNYPYQWTYSNNAPDESVTNKLLNGGTVINKLSDKIQYTVSAQWIAAARQGGTAEATYQLQIYDKTQNKWIPVQTPKKDNDGNIVYQNAEVTLNFDELHMSRETDDLNKFPEVDLYDESGVMNHYRVVQTQIKRTDNLISQTDEDDIGLTIAGNTTTEQNEIDVNDKYFVTLTKNGTNFDFKYRIKGNTYVRIEKIWLAEDHKTILNTATLTEQPPYTAVFDVQNFSNSERKYVDYFVETAQDLADGYYNDYVDSAYFQRDSSTNHIVFNPQALSDGNWTVTNIAVPKYDKDGREIAYRAIETSKTYPTLQTVLDNSEKEVSFYSNYDWDVNYQYDSNQPDKPENKNGKDTLYNYIVTNHRTIEGDEHAEIAISKEWVDDGELEYRAPIVIKASPEVYTKYTTDENGRTVATAMPAQSAELNQKNVWSDRFNISFRYQRDADGKIITDADENKVIDRTMTYTFTGTDKKYDPIHFKETPVEPYEKKTNGDYAYYWTKDEIEKGTLTDGLSWIYNLLTTEQWGYESTPLVNTVDSETNEAIPKNYTNLKDNNFVDFTSDFAGIYKSKPIDDNPQHCHYYAVRQVFDTTDSSNGTVGTLRFINTRIGVISYEVLFDWNVGDALKNNQIQSITIRISGQGLGENGYIEKTISPDDIKKITQGEKDKYAYYILNLPKYDTEGKLIPYKIEEVQINGQSAANGTFTIGTGTNADKCKVSVSSETIREGDTAKSDDLHTIVITNTFEADTTVKVNKVWIDNSNAENTRPDLHIRLFRKIASDTKVSPYGEEYDWHNVGNN